MGRLRTAWAAAPLALLVACGAGTEGGSERMCSMAGAPSGVSLVVAPPLAQDARIVDATVCWEDCAEGRVGLARFGAVGERQGFIQVQGLPAEEVEVAAVIQARDGTEISRIEARTTPEPRYPNGKACGAAGNQATVYLR